MKIIIFLISIFLAILSNGNFCPEIKKHWFVRFVLAFFSIYGFLLIAVNFQHNSLKVLDLFGYTAQKLSSHDQAIIDEMNQNGFIEPKYIDVNNPSDVNEPRQAENDSIELQHILEEESNF